jgi:alcohol dehydrogenase YqhD (iron-dependent ADH family)
MKKFAYKNPTQIYFGDGYTKAVGKLLKPYVKKVLLTYGKASIKNNGIYDTVVASLRENDIEFVEYDGIKPNPMLSHAIEGAKFAKEQGVDAVLAVGGGSVLDESKAIALGACCDDIDNLWDFFSYKKMPSDALKVFAVLTVPATGSEMNAGMVLTNDDTLEKFGFSSSHSHPVFSILDPANTISLPKQYTAYAAVDIFTHSTEAYFTKEDESSYVIDRAVEGVVKSLIESTNKIMQNPSDIDARANFMWTATLAWNGSLHCGVGNFGLPNHIIEHPISAVFDIAHGMGLAIVIPAWMKYFSNRYQSRFALFARNVFDVQEADDTKAAEICREKLVEWFKSLNVPTTFAEADIYSIDVEQLSSLAIAVMEAKQLSFITQDEVKKVLELAKK